MCLFFICYPGTSWDFCHQRPHRETLDPKLNEKNPSLGERSHIENYIRGPLKKPWALSFIYGFSSQGRVNEIFLIFAKKTYFSAGRGGNTVSVKIGDKSQKKRGMVL